MSNIQEGFKESAKIMETVSKEGVSYSFEKPEIRPVETVIYIVTAYRWGSRENHSYVVGCFNDLELAIKCADGQAIYRGGKYKCVVEESVMNKYVEDPADALAEHVKDVYWTR